MEQIERLALDAAAAFALDPPDRGAASAENGTDPEAIRAQEHLAMLRELARMGMDLARAIHSEGIAAKEAAESDSPAPSAAEAALPFTRIAKTVRQCLALEAKIAETMRRRQLGEIGEVGEALKQGLEYRRADKRRQVKRAVVDAIEAEAEAGGLYQSDAERLLDGLGERLDDAADDFDDRPVGECVALLCKKLGVAPDWVRWQAERWAVEEIAAKPKGSPYAGDWQVPVERMPRPGFRNPYLNQPQDPAGRDPPRRW
jgi:RNase P/RNase MRP subunit p29